MATTDALTGLHNRRYTGKAIRRPRPNSPRAAASRYADDADIDFCKSTNDNHGHDAGDDAPREFAVRIMEVDLAVSIFARRHGGEEFVIVMLGDRFCIVAGEPVAERLRRSIAGEPFAIAKRHQADRVSRFRPGRPTPGGEGRGGCRRASSAPTSALHRARLMTAATARVSSGGASRPTQRGTC